MGQSGSRAEYTLSESDQFWKSKADGSLIYYQVWKPRADVPIRGLVLGCHGLGEHVGRYEHVYSQFAQAGLAVLAPDFRGHGKTFWRNATESTKHVQGDVGGITTATLTDLVDLSKQAAELVDAQCTPELPRFIFGHSMGGVIALSLATLRDIPNLCGVVISAPALRPTSLNAFTYYALRLAAPVIGRVQDSNQLDLNGLSRDPAVLQRYKEDPLVHDRLTVRTAWDIVHCGETLEKAAPTLKPFKLLVAHGDADRLTSFAASRQFCQNLPKDTDATFVGLEGYFHELHNEPAPDGQQVIERYISWMCERLPGSSAAETSRGASSDVATAKL